MPVVLHSSPAGSSTAPTIEIHGDCKVFIENLLFDETVRRFYAWVTPDPSPRLGG
jgi:hypothetical protein